MVLLRGSKRNKGATCYVQSADNGALIYFTRSGRGILGGQKVVTQRIYRSRTDHMLSGVCGGLGQYFAIDSTVIRLSFVVGTILTSGVLIVLYVAMWLIIPEEPARP